MQPDLRTLEGQLAYLDYHSPDEAARACHDIVNNRFQDLWRFISDVLPDGPGKTRALHAVGDARMKCNSVIANEGA